jgi:hypothetical protein
MFSSPLKLILGFFVMFYIPSYKPNIDMQLCLHVKNHHCHMNNLKLDYSNFPTSFCVE